MNSPRELQWASLVLRTQASAWLHWLARAIARICAVITIAT